MIRRFVTTLALLALCALPARTALAVALDSPAVAVDAIGHGKVRLTITAGPSGAPSGFGVYWMTAEDYANYGSVWPSILSYPGLGWSMFTGAPTLNTFGEYSTFALGPNETIRIELGDLGGESGLTTNSPEELASGTEYVICTFARGGGGFTTSGFSTNAVSTLTLQGQNCTFTIGYWKTHGPAGCVTGNNSNAWPVSSLTLGTVNYGASQLCSILNQSPAGNGLVTLAHQLIGAKLNIANGANPGAAVLACISSADALIGGLVVPPVGGGSLSPGTTSSLTQCLDDFNNGLSGVPHCSSTPSKPTSWGRLKTLYR